MASGSTATGDGGIVVQQTGPQMVKHLLTTQLEQDGELQDHYDPATNTIQPDAFMSTVVEGAVGIDTPAAVVAKYAKKVTICRSNQDYYIYS